MMLAFITLALAALAQSAPASPPLNNLTSPYRLTAYVPGNCKYNGLKVNNLNLFQAKVAQYCPTQVGANCPNGTDQAFAGTLYPLSLVPGGQDLYVNYNGLMAITVQHSHSFPPNSYPSYIGWTWTALPVKQRPLHDCPASNPQYDCTPPTGWFTFRAPNATKGGVMACPNEYNPATTSLYAVTPAFNRTDCVKLLGLGTHNYTGPNPPVWAY